MIVSVTWSDNSSKSLKGGDSTNEDNKLLSQIKTEDKQVLSDPLSVQANGHKVIIEEEKITE